MKQLLLKTLAFLALAALPALAVTHYVDYVTGSDSNNGTSTSTPWKHAPGMIGLTPTGTATGDGCTANCASYTPVAGDFIILKGGTVWPYTTAPWMFTWAGTGSTSTYGCTGSGCIYVGNAVDAGLPAWNSGTVNSITLRNDFGGWSPSSPPGVSCSGGSGSGTAATAYVVPAAETNDPGIAGMIYNIALTSGGSGYTSAPACTLTGGSGTATLATDINRAIFDLGALHSSPPDWPMGQCGTYPQNASLAYATPCSPGLNLVAQYVILGGIEVRNMLMQQSTGSGTNDEHFTMIFMGRGNETVKDSLVHGLFIDCAVSGSPCSSIQDGQQDAIGPQNPYDQVENSIIENGDSVILGNTTQASNRICDTNLLCTSASFGIATATQEGYGPVDVHGNVLYDNLWQLRLVGNNASGSDPYLDYGNNFWMTLYGMNAQLPSPSHVNSRYEQLTTGATMYSWNNLIHNQVGGAGSQFQCDAGTTYYFYNESTWEIGTSTQPYSVDVVDGGGTGGCSMVLYNDTMYANQGGTCVNTQAATSTTTITMQNDHCITTPSALNPFWGPAETDNVFQNYAGSTITASVQAASTVQSISTANTQGYVAANGFAPTATSNGTYTFAAGGGSVNLTSLCSGYLTALCQDINGNVRPSSGGWQAGAYEYSGGGVAAPLPPVVLVTSITP